MLTHPENLFQWIGATEKPRSRTIIGAGVEINCFETGNAGLLRVSMIVFLEGGRCIIKYDNDMVGDS